MCCQQLVPSGHIVVCPYLDLEYLARALSFEPRDKLAVSLQERCLAAIWPAYLQIPGTRNMRRDERPARPSPVRSLNLACFRGLESEVRDGRSQAMLRRLLTRVAYARLVLARHSDSAASRWDWAGKFLEVVAREANRRGCWAVRERTALT